MRMGIGLELNQSQKIILTKELRQSIEMLHMTYMEMEELMAQEMNENPLLELEKKDEIDWDKYLEDLRDRTYKTSSSFYEEWDEERSHENTLCAPLSLYDHLHMEMSSLTLTESERRIAEFIIMQIEQDGYMRKDVKECIQGVKCSQDTFLRVLYKIQTLDPPGIGARNLQECLLLQLNRLEKKDPIVLKMIEQDLESIGRKRYKELMKKYALNEEELREKIESIKSLNPRPGQEFFCEPAIFVLPDVCVEIEEGFLKVYDNFSNMPVLHINGTYLKLLKQERDPETAAYVKEKLQSAVNLLRNIQQRKATILKVAQEIVAYQREFFFQGNASLRPLIMKEIAESTGFHESTISRTVNGKYMMTPQGLYPFKYFFSGGISQHEDEEGISTTTVKNRIKTMLEEEDKLKPHSDQKICELLETQGISISRRTVAKYREELGIASSSQRKEI